MSIGRDIEDALGERIGAQVVISLRSDPDGDDGDYVYVVQQKMGKSMIAETVGDTLGEAMTSLAEVMVR